MRNNNFRWKKHNVISMIDNINELLDIRKIEKKHKLKLVEEYDNKYTLKAFTIEFRNKTINQIGELTHMTLITMNVWTDAEKQRLEAILGLCKK